ncbi:MAG: exonuclease SbcCD subunit D [Bacteroidales bacterium]|nr:exonuclease SbcCD subunit D [Bacteroidales bacterium]
MRFLHTADLHLGQVMYQNYSREDEHQHFFSQLERWCGEYKPDALLVSGDIFDIQQPGAATKHAFNEYFVHLHNLYPEMRIVITAGNHDSASRIQADNVVWGMGNVTLVGRAPASDCTQQPDGWQEEYVVRLAGKGYIIALPYMVGSRKETLQALLNYVERENREGLPVVMMGHTAVAGTDFTGHDLDIGHIQTLDPSELGDGYDYLALGHIHRPQTLGYQQYEQEEVSLYPAGVMRYSGSALHVSCDEKYPHSVSLVEIGRHGGEVTVTRLRIDELRHFYELPADHSAQSYEEAVEAVETFAREGKRGYIRLKITYDTDLPSDFNQQIYDLIEGYGEEIRYNPKILWTDMPTEKKAVEKPVFEVADLQQMVNPMRFIEQTIDHYKGLSLEELRSAFEEIETEQKRIQEERSGK